MTEAKRRGAEDERSSAVSVDSGPLCRARAGRRRDESDVGIRWPVTRQRTCGPVRTRNHGRHARSRARSRRVLRRLGSRAASSGSTTPGHSTARISRPASSWRNPMRPRGCSCTAVFDAQLDVGVAASTGLPSSSPKWPRRSTMRSTHPIGIGASHWAIRKSITAAVSCSVSPDPATLDRTPM